MALEHIRPFRLAQPPQSGNASVDAWMRDVTNVINGLPFSFFSTANGPNASAVTAPQGFIGVEIGSSTTRFWIKRSGSTSTGWSHFSHI